jgi:hypothetical protein
VAQVNFNIDQVLMYNSLFEDFLTQCFGLSLPTLGYSMTHVLPFMALPCTFELPRAATNQNSGLIIQNNYEEFLSF